jgi:hypothetical protein
MVAARGVNTGVIVIFGWDVRVGRSGLSFSLSLYFVPPFERNELNERNAMKLNGRERPRRCDDGNRWSIFRGVLAGL